MVISWVFLADSKNTFQNKSLSSSQATFSFALMVLFLSFTSFTVYHDNRDFLSSTEFLNL